MQHIIYNIMKNNSLETKEIVSAVLQFPPPVPHPQLKP